MVKATTALHGHETEIEKSQIHNLHSTNGERTLTDGDNIMIDVFRWSRCKKAFPQKVMRSLGIPLPLEHLEVLCLHYFILDLSHILKSLKLFCFSNKISMLFIIKTSSFMFVKKWKLIYLDSVPLRYNLMVKDVCIRDQVQVLNIYIYCVLVRFLSQLIFTWLSSGWAYKYSSFFEMCMISTHKA